MKKDIMNHYIWVVLEAGETHELIAELDEKTIERLAEIFYDAVEDPEDPEAPKSVNEVADIIRQDALEGEVHEAYFSTYTLRRQELNTTVDGDTLLQDPDFEVKPGATVYEAAERIIMGCDMCHALDPMGYFTQEIKHPTLRGTEWHERNLS